MYRVLSTLVCNFVLRCKFHHSTIPDVANDNYCPQRYLFAMAIESSLTMHCPDDLLSLANFCFLVLLDLRRSAAGRLDCYLRKEEFIFSIFFIWRFVFGEVGE